MPKTRSRDTRAPPLAPGPCAETSVLRFEATVARTAPGGWAAFCCLVPPPLHAEPSPQPPFPSPFQGATAASQSGTPLSVRWQLLSRHLSVNVLLATGPKTVSQLPVLEQNAASLRLFVGSVYASKHSEQPNLLRLNSVLSPGGEGASQNPILAFI